MISIVFIFSFSPSNSPSHFHLWLLSLSLWYKSTTPLPLNSNLFVCARRRCDEDVNECDQSECGDRGECVNTFGSFYCNCSEGYEGLLCDNQTPADPGDDTQVWYKQSLCKSSRIQSSVIQNVLAFLAGFLHSQLAPNGTWHTQWSC